MAMSFLEVYFSQKKKTGFVKPVFDCRKSGQRAEKRVRPGADKAGDAGVLVIR